MQRPVAVLTPAYNAGRFLGAAIDSVLAQTTPHWRMIIVDDGSRDDTLAVARSYAAKDPRIEVHTQPNGGIAVTRNAALRRVPPECETILNLDADDMLEPVALERLTSYLQGHPDVGAVFCGATVVDAEGVRMGKRKTHRFELRAGVPWPLQADGPVPFFNFFCGYGVGPFALMRKSVVQAAGEYNTQLFTSEDSDMFVRIGLRAPIHQIGDLLYLYRRHGSNTSLYDERNQKAADLFHALWANPQGLTPEQERLVKGALRFHREWHPLILRGKFGMAAFRNAVRDRSPGRLAREAWQYKGVPVSIAIQSVRSIFKQA